MKIFKIFNTRNPICPQNLAVIFSTICAITLYSIVKQLFENNIVHKLSLLLITFFSIYFTFFCPHVYGNIPGLTFGLIALLFTLKYSYSNKLWHLIIISISITISYLLKNNYEIFLLAIIIELSLKALRDFNIKPIICVIGIIVVILGSKTLLYKHFEKTTNYSLDTGVPMLSYIYMGFAKEKTLSPGWYTADVDDIYTQSEYNTKKSNEITKDLIHQRLEYLSQNPLYTLNYFYVKLQTTWLNPTFQVFWCSTPGIMLDLSQEYNAYIAPKKMLISILCGTAFKIEERIMDIYEILIFLSASFSMFLIWKEGNLKRTLLPIVFLGGFLFHIIWETKSIYVLQYFYLLIPYAAYGLYRLFTILDKKIEQLKNYIKSQKKTTV